MPCRETVLAAGTGPHACLVEPKPAGRSVMCLPPPRPSTLLAAGIMINRCGGLYSGVFLVVLYPVVPHCC